MALENFIKSIWIASLMRSLRKAHVFASVANTDYTGQVNQLGDQVKINMIGNVTIKPFNKDSDIDSPESANSAQTTLIVDQANYFNVKVGDVEAVQEKPAVLQELTDNGSYGFRDVVDSYFAGLYTEAGAQLYASGTTPFDVTSANVEDVLAATSEQMNKLNIPMENRFIVIPPWFESKLVLSGLLTKTNNDQLWENGKIGRVLGFDLLVSNNVSMANTTTEADARLIAGVRRQSLGYAEAIVKIEAYRPEKRFEDAIKGLHVFGGKVLRPDMTVAVHCSKAAG